MAAPEIRDSDLFSAIIKTLLELRAEVDIAFEAIHRLRLELNGQPVEDEPEPGRPRFKVLDGGRYDDDKPKTITR